MEMSEFASFHLNNWLRPRKFLLFYFSAKNERVSIARLVVFTVQVDDLHALNRDIF